jgi:hypothetical protein
MKLFKFVKASRFFPTYAPTVKQFNNKILGTDGRRDVKFTDQDKKAIKAGLRAMLKDATTLQK